MLKYLFNRVQQHPGIGMALLGAFALGLLGLSASWTSPVAQEGPRVPVNDTRIPVLLAAHDGAGVAQQRFREVLRQRPSARWLAPDGKAPLSEEAIRQLSDSAHLAVFRDDRFPSARFGVRPDLRSL